MKRCINLLILYYLVIIGCGSNQIPQPVHELVELRMNLFRASQDSICRAIATLKAEQDVDSFFLRIKKQYLLDSINIPPKPVKPILDTQLTLDKSLPVKPLWDSLSIKKH